MFSFSTEWKSWGNETKREKMRVWSLDLYGFIVYLSVFGIWNIYKSIKNDKFWLSLYAFTIYTLISKFDFYRQCIVQSFFVGLEERWWRKKYKESTKEKRKEIYFWIKNDLESEVWRVWQSILEVFFYVWSFILGFIYFWINTWQTLVNSVIWIEIRDLE